jgi:hypothetical protein
MTASVVSLISSSGFKLSPLGTSATIWSTVPAPDGDEYGAVSGMRNGRGNQIQVKKSKAIPVTGRGCL